MAFWSVEKGSGQILPTYVFWAISFLIPVLVANINFLIVLADTALLGWKFSNTQAILDDEGVALGTLAFIGMSVMFGCCASLIVMMLAPATAGSGIPEVLGFLNGNEVTGIFSLRSLIVRTTGIVLSQAAGFPLGREGPMVSIGGTVGFGIAFIFTRRYEVSAEKVEHLEDDHPSLGVDQNISTSAFIRSQERFAQARRIGCALGGAAGIATAFNSPMGGILYMFEELSTSSLMPKFHVFVCTVISSFTSRLFLDFSSTNFHKLVIYDSDAADWHKAWDWIDVPFFAILAALLGGSGGLFTRGAITVWSFRAKTAKRLSKYQPFAKVIESCFYCALCTAIFCLVPVLLSCSSEDFSDAIGADPGHHRLLADKGSTGHVRHSCPEGQYSEAATLLLQGAEGAVKHLYSRTGPEQAIFPLLLVLFTYSTLAMGMPGLCVPMGTFIPNMLIGGITGRVLGEVISMTPAGPYAAPPGVYAVIGSASMLAGFTHMTIGIVALLAEAINDLGLIIPLMTSVYIASFVSRCMSHHGYDEQLIIKKGVPFLDSDLTDEMDTSKLTAVDICYIPPKEAILPRKVSLKTIKRALRHRDVNYFPVVSEGGHCTGLTTRGRLKAVLHAFDKKRQISGDEVQTGPGLNSVMPFDADAKQRVPPNGVDAIRARFSWLRLPRRPSSRRFSMETQMSSRSSQGHLTSHVVENRMKGMIRDMFSSPEKLYNSAAGDDECPEEHAPHEEGLLPIDRIMDPAPFMIQEGMPVQRFYPLFRNVDMNVIAVLSRSGKFLGLLTRRGLIAIARDHGHGKWIDELQAGNRRMRDEIEANWAAQRPQGMVEFSYEGFRRLVSSGNRTPSDSCVSESNYASDSESSDDDTPDESIAETKIPDNVPEDAIFDEELPVPSPRLHQSHRDSESDSGTPRREGSLRKHRRSASRRSDSRHGTSTSSTHDGSQPARASSRKSSRAQTFGNDFAPKDVAMTMAEMLGPTELRAQLASAWSRLAASEAQQEELIRRLSAVEREQKFMNQDPTDPGGGDIERSPSGLSLELPVHRRISGDRLELPRSASGSGNSSPCRSSSPKREPAQHPFVRVRRPSVCSRPSSTGSTNSYESASSHGERPSHGKHRKKKNSKDLLDELPAPSGASNRSSSHQSATPTPPEIDESELNIEVDIDRGLPPPLASSFAVSSPAPVAPDAPSFHLPEDAADDAAAVNVVVEDAADDAAAVNVVVEDDSMTPQMPPLVVLVDDQSGQADISKGCDSAGSPPDDGGSTGASPDSSSAANTVGL